MSNFILVIEDRERFRPILEAVSAGTSLKIVAVDNPAAAKRRIILEVPALIICSVGFLGDSEGGYRFCRELSEHESLSSIPVMLTADQLTEEMPRRGSEAGAKGIITWPITTDAIKRRIQPLLPAINLAAAPAETAKPAPPPAAAPAPVDPEFEAKIKTAQNLLARVLHNLKTSDLLQVVEIEDVPRIVLQMTRTVCGVKGDDEIKSGSTAEKQPQSRETELNLDRVFGKSGR